MLRQVFGVWRVLQQNFAYLGDPCIALHNLGKVQTGACRNVAHGFEALKCFA